MIFVDGEFIPSYSGATNRFHYLSDALQRYTNTEVVVVVSDRGWTDTKLIRKERFRTYLVRSDLFKNIDFLFHLVNREQPQILQFANLELAVQLGIPLSVMGGQHLVYEAHYDDLEFAKSLGAPKKQLDSVRGLMHHFGIYFDKIISLSKDDHLVKSRFGVSASRIAIVPSGIRLDDFPHSCFKATSKKIIFLGNYYYAVNLAALKLIRNSVYPKLSEKGYIFYIIGDIPSKIKKSLEKKNFVIVGKQSTLNTYFSNSLCALSPVAAGSGMRIKILDYLNAGLPVITTSQGSRGFLNRNLLMIEDDINKFSEIIELIARSTFTSRLLSEAGRRFVRKHMSWSVVAQSMSEEYDKILHKRRVTKINALNRISQLTARDPAWLKEVIKKGRFQGAKPHLSKKSYIVLN